MDSRNRPLGRWQFSLRTLCLVTTVIAVLLAWSGMLKLDAHRLGLLTLAAVGICLDALFYRNLLRRLFRRRRD